MDHDHARFWWTGETVRSQPAEKFSVQPDLTVDKLGYQMRQQAESARSHAEQLARLCERDRAREAAASADLSATMEAMKAAIDNALRLLNPEPTELKPAGLVRSGSQVSLKVVGQIG